MTRILPREEWHRLDSEAAALFRTIAQKDVAVVVVEEGGRVVAHLGVMRVPHFEGVWIAPEKRGNAGVTRALLRGAWDAAAEWCDQWFLAHAASDHVGGLLERLGGQEIKVRTYMMPREEACPLLYGCPPLLA